MSEHDDAGGLMPPGAMPENLATLVRPPAAGSAPLLDMASILEGSAQHFQLDLDQAPKAIATFRQVAHDLRILRAEARRLAEVPAPGLDAVSINAAREIGQWAGSEDPGSLRWALASGALELEKAADALERSLATYRDTDEGNAARLRRSQL
jgi:phosphate uptake regulator